MVTLSVNIIFIMDQILISVLWWRQRVRLSAWLAHSTRVNSILRCCPNAIQSCSLSLLVLLRVVICRGPLAIANHCLGVHRISVSLLGRRILITSWGHLMQISVHFLFVFRPTRKAILLHLILLNILTIFSIPMSQLLIRSRVIWRILAVFASMVAVSRVGSFGRTWIFLMGIFAGFIRVGNGQS